MRSIAALLCAGLVPTSACLVSYDDQGPAEAPGLDAVARLDDEPAGDRCPAGGVVVVTGTDDDRDGTLDAEEESGVVSVLCAGEDGAAARVVLLRVVAEDAGDACPFAGQRVESGLDEDRDEVLDDDEVDAVRFLCNGAPGAQGGQALVDVVEEAAGDNCPLGGARVSSGIDQDDDGTLDEEEVAVTSYACDGAPGAAGATGAAGSDALVDVTLEAPGVACPAGGQRVRAGLDADGDGALAEGEVSSTSYVCNGRSTIGGDGGGTALSGGVSEGTVAAAIDLTPGTFVPDAGSHVGTVAAGQSSYYRFTTLADPVGDASGPYSIALSDVDADVDVELYAGADFTTDPVAVTCAFEAPRLFVCSTAPLGEGTTYFVAVRETRNVALTYGITVSFGARTGTSAAPAAAMTSASVHGGGVSYFAIGGVPGDVKTVRLTNIRGALGAAPALVWEQLDDGAAFPAYGTCATQVGADVVCPTGRLRPGTLIAVRETTGAGALFDVSVEDGDTVTPAYPLETFTDVDSPVGQAPVVTLTTPSAGAHTLAWRRASGSYDTTAVEVYADRLSADARERRLAFCVQDCVITIPDDVGPGHVYLRLPQRTSGTETPHELALFRRGGDEGAPSAPLALPVGTVVDGSLASRSRYALPPTTADTRYSIRVTSEFGTNVRCEWFANPEQTPALYPVQTDVQVHGCVSEPVPAGTPLYFALWTYPAKPVIYTLEVMEGDGVTPVITLDEGVHTVVGGGAAYRQLAPLAPGPYTVATTTTGSVRRRVFPGYPRNADWSTHVARCESYSRFSTSATSPCTLRFVARASVPTWYLELVVSSHTVTVDPAPVPVLDHTVGTPTVYPVAAGETVWLAFDVPSAASYELDVTQTVTGSFVLQLYSPGYEELALATSTYVSAGTLATRALGELTPGRWVIEYDPPGSNAADVTVNVREVP